MLKIRATKSELRREIKQLREIGGLMANILFNLQYMDSLDANARLLCKSTCQKWDAIKRAEQ